MSIHTAARRNVDAGRWKRRRGLTLTEFAITSAVLVVVLFAGVSVVMRDTRLSRSTVAIGTAEAHARRLVDTLAHQLAGARAEIPPALLAAGPTQLVPVDGSRFCYRVQPGVEGAPGGWAALVFDARDVLREAELHHDLNRDGDRTDEFEVGRIRARTWEGADPFVQAGDMGLGPCVILQERCHRGSDLDHDGLEDPIFRWEPGRGRLLVRVFVIGRTTGEAPAVRRVEAAIDLGEAPVASAQTPEDRHCP
jgi:hypothetical protein